MPRIKRPLVLALTLGLGVFAGCERGEIREEVEDMKDTKDKVGRALKEQLAHAKDEASRLKEKLPAAETVKEELREVGADAKEALLRVGERVKRQAGDLKEAVREKLAEAD
jgi:hypothetical protein